MSVSPGTDAGPSAASFNLCRSKSCSLLSAPMRTWKRLSGGNGSICLLSTATAATSDGSIVKGAALSRDKLRSAASTSKLELISAVTATSAPTPVRSINIVMDSSCECGVALEKTTGSTLPPLLRAAPRSPRAPRVDRV